MGSEVNRPDGAGGKLVVMEAAEAGAAAGLGYFLVRHRHLEEIRGMVCPRSWQLSGTQQHRQRILG